MWWLAIGCAERVSFEEALPPDGLPRGTPSEEARARYALAADYSEDHGGQDLLVVEGEEVVFERQAEGYDPLVAHTLWSGTKSFGCALVQAAIANGDVGSLDEKVADTFAPLAANPDPRARDITVRELLQFTSGLKEDFGSLTRDGLRVEQQVADKPAAAAARPLLDAPGGTYEYGSSHLWVLSGWFRARTGQDPIDYLDAHVFGPIGLVHAGWIRDPAGNPALAYGAWTTAGQWAKYGELLRDDGRYGGVQVLPPGAVAECRTGSVANPAYGLTLWLNRETDTRRMPSRTLSDDGPVLYPEGPEDLFGAAGAQDQRLYVIPSRDLVIVRLGEGDRGYRDAELLARLLDGRDRPGQPSCATVSAPSVGLALLALLGLRRRR